MVEITYDGDWAVIRLPDVLDIGVVGDIRDTIDGLIRRGQHRLRFDVSGVEFMDSQGFVLLIGVNKSARAAGGDLQIVGASDALRRLFNASGLAWLLPPDESATRSE